MGITTKTAWFETVAEAQRRAQKRLPPSVYAALVAGSEKGITVGDNIDALAADCTVHVAFELAPPQLALVIVGVGLFTFGFFAGHSVSASWVGRRPVPARRSPWASHSAAGSWLAQRPRSWRLPVQVQGRAQRSPSGPVPHSATARCPGRRRRPAHQDAEK